MYIAIATLSSFAFLIPTIFCIILRFCATPTLLSCCTKYTSTELTKLSKYIKRKADESSQKETQEKENPKVSNPIIQKHIKVQPQTANIPIQTGLITKNNDTHAIQIHSPRNSMTIEHLKTKQEQTNVQTPCTTMQSFMPLKSSTPKINNKEIQNQGKTATSKPPEPIIKQKQEADIVCNTTACKESHKPQQKQEKRNNIECNTTACGHSHKQPAPQKIKFNVDSQNQPIALYDIPRKLNISDLPTHEQQMLEMNQLIAKLKTEKDEQKKHEHTTIDMTKERFI